MANPLFQTLNPDVCITPLWKASGHSGHTQQIECAAPPYYKTRCIPLVTGLTRDGVPLALQVEAFCLEHDIGLVMVGPEVPLVDGLADSLTAAHLRYCPAAAAGRTPR